MHSYENERYILHSYVDIKENEGMIRGSKRKLTSKRLNDWIDINRKNRAFDSELKNTGMFFSVLI